MLIAIGKINIRFLVYSLSYIITQILLNSITFSFKLKFVDLKIKNIPLILIITHSSLIFFIIIECRVRKLFNKKETNENELKDGKRKGKELKLIYNKSKKVNIKEPLNLILMILLELIYDTSLLAYQKKEEEQSELVIAEIYKFMDILFLLIFFRVFHKILFYKHQYISLIIIILTGLARFFRVFEYFFHEEGKEFGIITLGFIILLPLIDSVKIYIIQKYMKYNYYSPYFILFLIGVTYLIVSLIILIIFKNINCSTEICKSLSEINIESNKVVNYILIILYSLFYGLEHFIKFYTMYTFSAFHYILISTFGEIIQFGYKMILNFDTTDLIVNLVTYSVEIFAVLVFIETIELNFCGLNMNLKKNIIFRADNELYLINKSRTENEDNISESNDSERLNEVDTNIENNSVVF
jgi:hypothetical protein